jgi:hypothetical protein
MAVAAGTSLAFGLWGYARGPVRSRLNSGSIDAMWPFLEGIRDTRRAFAVGCWHDGAYLGGLIGTIVACGVVQRWRRRPLKGNCGAG